MAEPLIDVVLPVFNAATTIRSAIESLQQQTVRDIRIIVINDGSTDGTRDIVRAMAADDQRIDPVDRPNGGIVDALNHGVSLCRAPLLARHDGDDLAYPDRFAVQSAYLSDHPDCIAVGGPARHIDEHGGTKGFIARPDTPDTARPTWAPALEPYIIHPFLMTYREHVAAVGGYRHVFNAEDSDLYWRLQEVGRLHNIRDHVLGDYRMHSASVSSGSIVTGRINAIFSQLAALSAVRRRSGEQDLEFGRGVRNDYVAAGTLAAMVELAGRPLRPDERVDLATKASAKLLELASYRPFEPDLEDCRFISEAFRQGAGRLEPANRVHVSRVVANASARLIASGRVREGMALARPPYYRRIASRVAFRMLTTTRTRAAIRRLGPNPRDYLK